MAESDICFYDTDKKRFTIGDPDGHGLASLSDESISGAPPARGLKTSAYNALASSTVELLVAPGYGTGFALNESEQVSTNAHVALFNRQLTVKTPSGKELDATIVRLELSTDTAILEAPELKSEGVRPVSINRDGPATAGENGYVLGFYGPAGGETKCISAGVVKTVSANSDDSSNADKERRNFLEFESYWEPLNPHAGALIHQNQEAYQILADQFSNRAIIDSDIVARQGTSGGALAGADTRAIGMADYIHSSAGVLASTPIDSILSLASQPSRFKFTYERGPHLVLRHVEAIDPSARAEAELANAILDKDSLKPGTGVGL